MGELRKPRGNAPKKVPAWQLWEKVPQNKETVKRVAGSDYAYIGRRNAITSRLYGAEPQETKDAFEAQATAEHKVAVERHRDALSGMPSLDPEDQAM